MPCWGDARVSTPATGAGGPGRAGELMSAAVQEMPAPSSPPPRKLRWPTPCAATSRAWRPKLSRRTPGEPPSANRQAPSRFTTFMRCCDDITDDVNLFPHERRQKLEAWLEALHRVQSGQSSDDPVLLALNDTQRRFKIPPELLDQLAYGTGMDIPENGSQNPSGAEGYSRFFITRLPIFACIATGWLRLWDWSASGYSATGIRRQNRWRRTWAWRSS